MLLYSVLFHLAWFLGWRLLKNLMTYSTHFFENLELWQLFMALLLILCVLTTLRSWTCLNVLDYAPLMSNVTSLSSEVVFHVHELFGLAPAIIIQAVFFRVISPAGCETKLPSNVISYSILEFKKRRSTVFDCVIVANIRHRSSCITSFTSVWNHLISMIVPA
jgi:hypothetical protein